MRYCKINPHPDCEKSPCGKLTYVVCGLPDARGNEPVFILHEGEENCIPAWAAAELQARGHDVTEINEIKDGAHAALPGVTADHVDIEHEIASAPVNEVDKFLRHHAWHDHLAHHEPTGRAALRRHISAETEKNGGVRVVVSHTPFHTPDQLRAKAFEIHRMHGHKRVERALAAKAV